MAHPLSRKDFLQLVGGLVALGAVLEACGSDEADSAATTTAGTVTGTPTTTAPVPTTGTQADSCKTGGAKDEGLDDPKHHLVVPAADVVAGTAKTYSIQGTETHDHKVTIDANDFAKLAMDTRVVVTSTRDSGHSHTFLVVCA
jgi:hypothetical protein